MGGTLTTAQKAEYCDEMVFLYLFDSEYWGHPMDVVLLIAALIECIIACHIIRHKHLRSHPAPFIAALCLSDSFFGFLGVSRYLVCHMGNAEGLVALTVYFDMSEESQLRAMKLIVNSYTFFMFFCYNFSSVIDIALQIDLVKTLQQPFSPVKKRQYWGFACATFFSILCGVAVLCADLNLKSPAVLILFFGQKVVYFPAAIYSLSLAVYSFM